MERTTRWDHSQKLSCEVRMFWRRFVAWETSSYAILPISYCQAQNDFPVNTFNHTETEAGSEGHNLCQIRA